MREWGLFAVVCGAFLLWVLLSDKKREEGWYDIHAALARQANIDVDDLIMPTFTDRSKVQYQFNPEDGTPDVPSGVLMLDPGQTLELRWGPSHAFYFWAQAPTDREIELLEPPEDVIRLIEVSGPAPDRLATALRGDAWLELGVYSDDAKPHLCRFRVTSLSVKRSVNDGGSFHYRTQSLPDTTFSVLVAGGGSGPTAVARDD